MKATPAYILRNCAFWADNDIKVGQVPEIGIPMPKEKTEKMRNAGMIKERTVSMGYEMPDLTFKMTGMDPASHALMTGRPGTEHPFMATGALVDEDGTTHSAVLYVRGRVTEIGSPTWKPGEMADSEFTVSPNYAKLEIDGAPVFEIDDFDYSVGGVSQTGDIRAALLI